MRRIVVVLPAVCATAAIGVPVALAVSPHFVSTSAQLSGTNLSVSFKEAGLGQTSRSRMWPCGFHRHLRLREPGVAPIRAPRTKTTISGPVSATGTFSSGKNGQVAASLTLNPPGGSFSCPSGQSLEIAQVTYTNVTVTDTTNGITESIPGTFDTGCLLPNVRGAC
jgi:hypothetical protein